MSPQYKLMYTNRRGVAEPIRMMFKLKGVEFEDIRYSCEEWTATKASMPWGQVPVLEVDGERIAQSKAIIRYVAKKLDLVGETEMDAAKCDEYLEALDDAKHAIVAWSAEKDNAKKAELLKKLEEETLPKYFSKFESILEKNGNGLLVGKKLTFVDILLANGAENWKMHFSGFDTSKFPAVQKHRDFVLGQPGIKEWIAIRP